MKSKSVERLQQAMPEDIKIFVDLYADLMVYINNKSHESGISKKELIEIIKILITKI